MTCLIGYVGEGLNVVPLETFGCPHVRDGCLNTGGKFILGGGTADQALQGLFVRAWNGAV